LGDALDKVIKASGEFNFTNPNLIEASFLDSFDVIRNKDKLIKISEEVYMNQETQSLLRRERKKT